MNKIQRYLFLIRKIYKHDNFKDQYSKLNMNIYKKVPVKIFKEQLMKVDPQLINNRIQQLEISIFGKDVERIQKSKDKKGLVQEGSKALSGGGGLNIIKYQMPQKIMVLRNYLESINVNSINYYERQYLKNQSTQSPKDKQIPLTSQTSQELQFASYKPQQNMSSTLNWLFKTRSQIFLDPSQQKSQHHKPRQENISNMIPTLNDEQLNKKLSQFKNTNLYKHPHYNYGKIDELLLHYDLKKIEQFDNDVFHHLEMLDKASTTQQMESWMKKIVFRFVAYKSYCIFYLQKVELQKIGKFVNLFLSIINKHSSLLFFNKWKLILHFIDIVLSNTQLTNSEGLYNNGTKSQQIYLIILKQLEQFIINLQNVKLTSVQLDLFLETFELFQSIKTTIFKILTFQNENRSQRIGECLVKMQQFVFPQSLNEQLDELFPDEMLREDKIGQEGIMVRWLKLIDRFMLFVNRQEMVVNEGLFEKIVELIDRFIDANKAEVFDSYNKSMIRQQIEPLEDILVPEYLCILTSQFNGHLIMFLFNHQLPSNSPILITSTLRYLWQHIHKHFTKSYHSLKQFLLFFNILIRQDKNCLQTSQKAQFYDKLCQSIKYIFQLNYQELMSRQISNFLIQSSKEMFDGRQLEQLLKIIKFSYREE